MVTRPPRKFSKLKNKNRGQNIEGEGEAIHRELCGKIKNEKGTVNNILRDIRR